MGYSKDYIFQKFFFFFLTHSSISKCPDSCFNQKDIFSQYLRENFISIY